MMTNLCIFLDFFGAETQVIDFPLITFNCFVYTETSPIHQHKFSVINYNDKLKLDHFH